MRRLAALLVAPLVLLACAAAPASTPTATTANKPAVTPPPTVAADSSLPPEPSGASVPAGLPVLAAPVETPTTVTGTTDPDLQPHIGGLGPDGWAPHGPAGAYCWPDSVAIQSSMEKWPGFQSIYTLGVGTAYYTTAWLRYTGWIGWLNGGNWQFREGPAIIAAEELNAGTVPTWVWLNNGWQQTSTVPNDAAGYFGNDSKVPIPFHGSFRVWTYYYWYPLYEGTDERPGRLAFTGGGHFDKVGDITC